MELKGRTPYINNESLISHLFIKEPDGLPVKIRFNGTSQFAECSANVSVTTVLSGLQKLPKIGRPHDIRLWAVKLISQKPHVTSSVTYKGAGWSTHYTYQSSIWRDLTICNRCSKCFCYNIPQQFTETSENWEASWYHILTGRIKEQDGWWLYQSKFDLTRLTNLQQVQQKFLLQDLQNVLKIPEVV